MKDQSRFTRNHYRRGKAFGVLFLTFLLLFPAGALMPVWCASAETKIISNAVDTTTTLSGDIPLATNSNGLPRRRFNTVHLMVGIGAATSNYSELDPLGVNKPNISIPISIYAYIPFQHNKTGIFALTGFDFDLAVANHFAFKALMLYQGRSGIMMGMGAGRTSFAFYEEVHVVTDQTHGLIALGINLSSKRADLLLTVPFAPSLSTQFDGTEYSVRPAGIQISFLLSIRS